MTRFPFVALVNGTPVVVESPRRVRPLTAKEAAALALAAESLLASEKAT